MATMTAAAYKITDKQKALLQALYTHCYCIQHEGSKKDFGFHAEQLDAAGVSWSVQNIVAGLADDRKSKHKYFSILLKQKNIEIEG